MLLTNFILFQLAWFACVVGAANEMPWLGVVCTFAILLWHFYKSVRAKAELLLLSLTLFIGACFDQMMLLMHLVEYQQHGWSEVFVPVWIMALWLAFGSTLNVSLAWLQGRNLISVVFGAVGGPLAYLAAESIGAVVLRGYPSYMALSIGWAVITPALLYAAGKLNGFKTESTL